MFSRRDIQCSLDRLAGVLAPAQLSRLVQRLNSSVVEEHVSARWETIVLAATASVAQLKHETDCGGPSRLDIRAAFTGLGIELLADVCAVSDADMEAENPFDHFQWAVLEAAQAMGMPAAGLYVDVESVVERQSKTQRRILALPRKGETAEFVRVHVRPFLAEIAADRSVDRSWNYDDGDVRFVIRFVAAEPRLSGGSHPTYTWPRTTRHNPLFGALAKKSTQLRKSGFTGIKGIIACDAGCESIATADEKVVRAFFEQHQQTVSFVATIVVRERSYGRQGSRRLPVEVRFFWNRRHDVSARESVRDAIGRIAKAMPPAYRASTYARQLDVDRDGRFRNSFEGGYTLMGGQRERIKISARAALDALAGNIRRQGEHHSIPVPVFQAQIREGRTIRSATVERNEHDDDDWLVLEFDGPDAAVAPFRVPNETQSGANGSGTTDGEAAK